MRWRVACVCALSPFAILAASFAFLPALLSTGFFAFAAAAGAAAGAAATATGAGDAAAAGATAACRVAAAKVDKYMGCIMSVDALAPIMNTLPPWSCKLDKVVQRGAVGVGRAEPSNCLLHAA